MRLSRDRDLGSWKAQGGQCQVSPLCHALREAIMWGPPFLGKQLCRVVLGRDLPNPLPPGECGLQAPTCHVEMLKVVQAKAVAS